MRDWGIKKRVLFLALLPAFLVSMLLAGYLIFTQLRDLEETLSERGFALVRHLGKVSEYGVISGSSDILNPIVSSIINEPDVRSVQISDQYGEELASAGVPGYRQSLINTLKQAPVSVISRESNSLIFHAPIQRSEFVIDEHLDEELQVLESENGSDHIDPAEKIIGWITVEFDRSRTVTRRNELVESSILLTLLVLAISVVLAVSLGRDVAQPIMVMTDTVRRVESGDLDNKIVVGTGGELGKLASGMNAMIAALKTAQTDLQQRVDQATANYKEALSLLERKNAELDNARKLAEAASNAKSEFLANVSHEIRNPLNGVLGFIKLLFKTDLSQQQDGYLHTIDVSAKNLLRIISDLLDLSRIEAGKMSLDYKVFSVREMLSDIISLHMPAVTEKNLQLNLEVDEQLPDFEEGDPVRIGQVLSNLIGNAIKFTDKGEIKVCCIVRENVKHRLVLEFTVSDTGQGIELEHQRSVYDSFFQVDGSTRRHYGGVGLGLAIAKKLIEMMGGKINLQSIPGKGTTVTFSVVLTTSPVKSTNNSVDNEAISGLGKMVLFDGVMRVLVVDDNEINRNLSSILMTGYGVEVDQADSAYSALEKVERNKYDLILMDVHMPRMDGIEATREIRGLGKLNQDTPIVALTADIVADRRKHFLEAGMNDYLAKPIEEHALLSIFLKWCPDKAKPGSLLVKTPIKTLDESGVDEPPTLDSTLGIRYASMKESVWKKSLSLLMGKLHNELGELGKLLEHENRVEIAATAHGIKGSANYCGAVALANAAELLEKTAAEADMEQISSATKGLVNAATSLNQHIRRYYPDVDTIVNFGENNNE
jgi:two-component system sensor histidine kinase BarA